MAVDRIQLAGALAEIVADPPETANIPERLCQACHAALPVDGVGLSLMTKDQPDGRVLLGASDARGARIEDWQFGLGEGPCVSAFIAGQPMLVPDLQAREARLRCPMFTREAEDAGVGSRLGIRVSAADRADRYRCDGLLPPADGAADGDGGGAGGHRCRDHGTAERRDGQRGGRGRRSRPVRPVLAHSRGGTSGHRRAGGRARHIGRRGTGPVARQRVRLRAAAGGGRRGRTDGETEISGCRPRPTRGLS